MFRKLPHAGLHTQTCKVYVCHRCSTPDRVEPRSFIVCGNLFCYNNEDRGITWNTPLVGHATTRDLVSRRQFPAYRQPNMAKPFVCAHVSRNAHRADPNQPATNGQTPLHACVLVSLGADWLPKIVGVSIQTQYQGRSCKCCPRSVCNNAPYLFTKTRSFMLLLQL